MFCFYQMVLALTQELSSSPVPPGYWTSQWERHISHLVQLVKPWLDSREWRLLCFSRLGVERLCPTLCCLSRELCDPAWTVWHGLASDSTCRVLNHLTENFFLCPWQGAENWRRNGLIGLTSSLLLSLWLPAEFSSGTHLQGLFMGDASSSLTLHLSLLNPIRFGFKI